MAGSAMLSGHPPHKAHACTGWGPPSSAARLWEQRVTGQHRRSNFKSFPASFGKDFDDKSNEQINPSH